MSIEEQLKDIVASIVHVDKSLIHREGTFKELNAKIHSYLSWE